MTAKFSISLTDGQHAFIKMLVEDGRYSSVSAVLQQGLELLRNRLEAEAVEREALKAILSQRQSGAFVGEAEMDDRLEAMMAEKRRAHGLSS